MEIREIKHNKKQFLPLLLLADEQESMIDRYLDCGTMFVLIDDVDPVLAPSEDTPLTPVSEDHVPKPGNEDRVSISQNATPASSRVVAECATLASSRAADMHITATHPRVVAECVVTDEGDGILEIKNIATDPALQGRGYGRALIEFVAREYRDDFTILQVGTGDSPLTVPFYERCGFTRSHRVANFFTDNYDHPIIEAGVQLVDMVYLRRTL